jgi:hypothetical protein
MSDTPLAPSDAERAEWPDCTRSYVEWLESRDTAPLTASVLADALDCFWNAALGAAHQRQEGFATANIMVEGIAAVARRLHEVSHDPQ